MDILAAYDNGNTSVIIYDDGTKVREFEGTPQPLHPESIDVKITNWCDGACSYCHEKSTKRGQHADLNRLLDVLSPLPRGVELALGGGDPFSHPDLIPFLVHAKEKGWIVNITINQKHLARSLPLIKQMVARDLVKGIGISYNNRKLLGDVEPILKLTPHVVFHLITGVNTPEDLNDLQSLCLDCNRPAKVLILGYKQYGFGLGYYTRNNVAENLNAWYRALPREVNRKEMVFSFDNLAIDQLGVRRVLSKQAWEAFYMGDDFTFTMYADAVSEMFAPTSTSDERISFDMGILKFFSKDT